MSGHSKWANIKRKKGANDAARGQVFTKIGREIQVAVRQGGPDPDGNFRLKLCIQKAKANNMPGDNINRCIQKAAGLGEADAIEEFFYEGYGPGGVAILCEMMTDNRNRCAAEIRHTFSRNNGNLGESGCVSYMFERKGEIVVDMSNVDEEELFEAVLEAGAEDMLTDPGDEDEDVAPSGTVYCAPGDLQAVQDAIEAAGFKVSAAQVMMKPSNVIEIEDADLAAKLLRLIDALEDNDDVNNVYANYEISDEIMAQLDN